MNLQKLKYAIKDLTIKERILFVKFILDTITDTTSCQEANLVNEWKEELEKRSKAYKTKNVSTNSWSDVKAKLS